MYLSRHIRPPCHVKPSRQSVTASVTMRTASSILVAIVAVSAFAVPALGYNNVCGGVGLRWLFASGFLTSRSVFQPGHGLCSPTWVEQLEPYVLQQLWLLCLPRWDVLTCVWSWCCYGALRFRCAGGGFVVVDTQPLRKIRRLPHRLTSSLCVTPSPACNVNETLLRETAVRWWPAPVPVCVCVCLCVL